MKQALNNPSPYSLAHLLLFVALGLLSSALAAQQFTANDDDYQRCIIDYVAPTQSEKAARWLTRTCHREHSHQGSVTVLDRCLRQTLTHAQNDIAATELHRLCHLRSKRT